MNNIIIELKKYIIENRENISRNKMISILDNYELTYDEYQELVSLINETKYQNTSNSLKRYLIEIAKYPILNYDEQLNLFKKFHSGDNEAREKLINSNLKFVVSVAKKYSINSYELMDLIGYGNLGLIKAVDTFDYTMGYKFTTYAFFWIRHFISRSFDNKLVKIYQKDKDILKKIETYSIKLENLLHRIPNINEIVSYYNSQTENTPITVDEVLYLYKIAKNPISLNAKIKTADKDKTEIMHFLKDENINLSDEAINNVYYEKIRDIILGNTKSNLNEKEREVLNLFFGFTGEPLSLEQIAKKYEVTRQRILQIKKRALHKLMTHEKTKKILTPNF